MLSRSPADRARTSAAPSERYDRPSERPFPNDVSQPPSPSKRQPLLQKTDGLYNELRDRWTNRRLPKVGPPPVVFDLQRPAAEYWMARVGQHTHDSYAGVGMAKFPEDLRTYEHLLWAQAPTVVIEIGTSFGASALWFRDRLRTLEAYGRLVAPRVISIDLQIDGARENLLRVDPDFASTIELIEADVCDPELPMRVAEHIPPGASCLVIEDSAHIYDTTMAALKGFSRFVPPGGFFVVEDGYVDIEECRTSPVLPRGVLPALRDWLQTPEGRRFAVHRDLEIYGMSSHPSGFLVRTR
jgi:cephalosporin hydroxylase